MKTKKTPVTAPKRKVEASKSTTAKIAAAKKTIEARKQARDEEKKIRRESSQKRLEILKRFKSQAELKGFDKGVVTDLKARIREDGGVYTVVSSKGNLSFRLKKDSFEVIKRIAQGGMVDENGTPVVGEGPAEPEAPTKAAPVPGEEPAPEAAPAAPDAEMGMETDTEVMPGAEDHARALVTVNDKIAEIEKRDEVDKILKTELESVRNELTGVAAALRKMKVSAKKQEKVTASKLGKEELKAIAAFLGKADDCYKNQMTGFESKASFADKKGLTHVVAGIRSKTDAALEKSHDTIVAYKKEKATADDVRNSVREVKAALQEWQVFKQTSELFRSEARYANASKEQLKKVIAATNELVEEGQIPQSEFAAQAFSYLELNEKEFKTVHASLKRRANMSGGETPKRVPSVQNFASGDSLENIFED